MKSTALARVSVVAACLVLAALSCPTASWARIDGGGWFSRLVSMSVDGTFYVSSQGYFDNANQGAVWAFLPKARCVGGVNADKTCEGAAPAFCGTGVCSPVKWVFKVPSVTKVFGSPTLDPGSNLGSAADDRIYVGDDGGNLYALEANGSVCPGDAGHPGVPKLCNFLWDYVPGDYVSVTTASAFKGGPAFDADPSHDRVYIGSQSGWVHAVNRQNGARSSGSWPHSLPTSFLRFTPVVNALHHVIIGGAESGLFGVDPVGNNNGPATIWTYGRPHTGCAAYNEGYETGGVLASDGVTLFVSGDNYLSKINTSTNPPQLTYRYPIVGTRQRPVLNAGQDTVYLGHRAVGELHAIPAAGSCPVTDWKYETQQNISFSSAAVHPETGMVFIGVEDQCLYALDPAGFNPSDPEYGRLRRWDFKSFGSSMAPAQNAFHSTPAVFKGPFTNGSGTEVLDRVLVGDNGGVVYALDVQMPCSETWSQDPTVPICNAGDNFNRAKWCFDTHFLTPGCPSPGNPGADNSCCDPDVSPFNCKPKAPSGCTNGPTCGCTGTQCSSCSPTQCGPCPGPSPTGCAP